MKFTVVKNKNETKLKIVENNKIFDVFPKKKNSNILDAIANYDEIKKKKEEILLSKSEIFVKEESTFPFWPLKKIICLGLNYIDHVREGGYETPTYPTLFVRFPSSLVEPNKSIIKPKISDKLDYEAELLVLIGTKVKNIDEKEAEKCVFAYSVFNDGSVRDYQKKTHQWTPGKNFDSTGCMGSTYVTPDELPIGASGLKIQCIVNGKIMQDANTSEMMWPVFKTISTLSKFTTLEKGDLLIMGTPPGVGQARKPSFFLKKGYKVETLIEKIDHITNEVVDEIG